MKKLFAKIFAGALALTAAFGFAACKEDDLKVDVYMPDGAPALALAQMMQERDDDITYHVVEAGAMQGLVTGTNPEADLAVMPVNLAAKMLGSGENYTLLGTVTHGNLYLMSTDNTHTYNVGSDLSALVGKTIGVIQMHNVPGLTFKLILEKYDVEYKVIESMVHAEETKVNLVPVDNPTTITPASGLDGYVVAEPMASLKVKGTASSAKPFHIVGSLQNLYGGTNGYPQAVLVAKNSVAKNKEFVADFVEDVIEAAAWLQKSETTIDEIVNAISSNLKEGLTPTLSAGNLTKEVIANCGVYFTKANVGKQEIIDFIAALSQVQDVQYTLNDNFFYQF